MKTIKTLAIIFALSATASYGATPYSVNLDSSEKTLELAVKQLMELDSKKSAYFEETENQFGSEDLYTKALKDEFGTINSEEITLEAILNNVAYNVASLSEAEVQEETMKKAKAHQSALDQIYKKYLTYTNGKSKGWFGSKYKTGLTRSKNNGSRMDHIAELIKAKLGKDFSSSLSEVEFHQNFINFVKSENLEIQKTKHQSLLTAYENAFMNHKSIKGSNILDGFKVISAVLRNKHEFGGIVLGKGKTVKVIIPGTKTLHDWAYNIDFTGSQGDALTGTGRGLNIHKGFMAAYSEARDIFVPKLQDYAKTHQVDVVEVSGHSLGAAIATILAYDIKDTVLKDSFVRLVTFGSPRVVDNTSKEIIEKKLGLGNILRVANIYDPVTKVPAEFLNSAHVGTPILVEDEYSYFAALKGGVEYHSMVRYYNTAKEAFEKIQKVAQNRSELEETYKMASDFYNESYENFMKEVNEKAKIEFLEKKQKYEESNISKEDLRELADMQLGVSKEVADNEDSSDNEIDDAIVMVAKANENKMDAMNMSIYEGHMENVAKIKPKKRDVLQQNILRVSK